jgi:hypothetical protein
MGCATSWAIFFTNTFGHTQLHLEFFFRFQRCGKQERFFEAKKKFVE